MTTTKTCDFCAFTNQYVCDPRQHCGLCPKGNQEEESLPGMTEKDYEV